MSGEAFYDVVSFTVGLVSIRCGARTPPLRLTSRRTKMTSETRLGIIEPYEHQCGNIDRIKESVNESEKFCKQAILAIESQTVIQANREACHRLNGIEEDIEELRTAIEQVRQWGEQWKSLAKELIDEFKPELLKEELEFDDDIPF